MFPDREENILSTTPGLIQAAPLLLEEAGSSLADETFYFSSDSTGHLSGHHPLPPHASLGVSSRSWNHGVAGPTVYGPSTELLGAPIALTTGFHSTACSPETNSPILVGARLFPLSLFGFELFYCSTNSS